MSSGPAPAVPLENDLPGPVERPGGRAGPPLRGQAVRRSWLAATLSLPVAAVLVVVATFALRGQPPVETAPQAVHLSAGRLAAEATPGQPLLVRTPHGEVSARGARFEVLVGARFTRLDVERGRALLARPGGAEPLVVEAGESAVASDGVLRRERCCAAPWRAGEARSHADVPLAR
jgi:hypothetical protein